MERSPRGGVRPTALLVVVLLAVMVAMPAAFATPIDGTTPFGNSLDGNSLDGNSLDGNSLDGNSLDGNSLD